MKLKNLIAFAFFLLAQNLFAQEEKVVSSFKEGTVLKSSDIGFLSMVAGEKINPDNKERKATIKEVTYKAGMKLSKNDAANINSKFEQFKKEYKAPAPVRGNRICFYWYYYCDSYGNCYYYKYYYYCN